MKWLIDHQVKWQFICFFFDQQIDFWLIVAASPHFETKIHYNRAHNFAKAPLIQ